MNVSAVKSANVAKNSFNGYGMQANQPKKPVRYSDWGGMYIPVYEEDEDKRSLTEAIQNELEMMAKYNQIQAKRAAKVADNTPDKDITIIIKATEPKHQENQKDNNKVYYSSWGGDYIFPLEGNPYEKA